MGDVLGVKEITGLNGKSGAIPYFSIVPEIGKVYTDSTVPSPDMVKQTEYQEQNGFYKLKCGLIPHRPGIYGISIADLPNVAKECDRAAIVMEFSPDLDKHLNYIKDIYYGGGTVPSFDSTHGYCFKVYSP